MRILVGHTTEICSPAFCITTGVERSFWPDIGVPGWIEFDAIALDRAARRDVDVERRLANGLGIEAAIFFLGDRQHTVEQNPGLVEAHRTMRGNVGRTGLLLVACHHGLGEIADPGRQFGGIEQLRGHRIDIAEIVDVRAERGAQLVELAVPRAGAEQHLERSPLSRACRNKRVMSGL